MDRLRQKGKKDKTDVKSIKEISKIKEILRTVKMNSSMRLRAPHGSKVMDNKDFNDNEDLFEELATSTDQSEIEMPSATNPNVVFHDSSIELSNKNKNNIDMVNAKQSANISQDINDITEVEDTKALESQIQSDQRVTKELETQNEDVLSKKPLEQQDDQRSTKDLEMEPVQQIIRDLIDLSEGNTKDLSNVDLETRSSSSIVNLSQEPSDPETPCNQVNVLLESQSTGQSENQLEDITQESPTVKPEEKCENTINKAHLEQDSDLSHSLEHLKNESREVTEQAPTEKPEQVEKPTQEETQHFIDEQSNQIPQEVQPEERPGVSLKSNNDVVVIVESTDEQHATEIPKITTRSRKLSLDHSLLTAREGLSQSEVDLNSIGKSPLERKSSFFRKKMDSFFRNTTEMFKKQSFNSKPQPIQRRGSMSVSLQSLNERTSDLNSDFTAGLLKTQQEEIPSSMTSLSSASTLGRSASSVSMYNSEVLNPRQGSEQSLVGNQPTLHVTHALGGYPSNSVHSLNESYLHDTLLQNRAISMSSGLDSQSWLRRKKSTSSNRSNRVTWVASEGVTNYFRRMIQKENSKNIQEDQTYQDSRIPENKAYVKTDSKGRRLSYQRAVSGEDPVLPSRYHDSSFRRRPLPDHSEENPEISAQLAVYTDHGVPALRGFETAIISDAAQNTLIWAQNKANVEQFIGMDATGKQTVLCELITTEADYINHLQIVVNMFLSSAHRLQDEGKMLDVDTSQLFLNLPDILNANRIFWELTFHPMISLALEKDVPFQIMLMEPGFLSLPEVFAPYEKYALDQPRANEYLRSLSGNVDFSTYLAWCHSLKGCQRLQITDLLVKPIQRVTKYSLLLKRIAQFTDTENELNSVNLMEQTVKTFVTELNRGVKQRQEVEKAEYYARSVENFEVDSLQAFFQEFKDEEMDDYYYRMFTQSNLRAPMLNSHSQHARTVIHVGDLRFKDGNKEIEVRAILFTDMLIVCKKQSKGSPYQYKMIRPKYMIDKLVAFPKYGVRNNNMEMTFIFVVMVDDFGSCYTCFTLTESSKDPNGSETLKLWEQKIKEAQYTYNLAVWLYHNPSYNISDLDVDLASDHVNSSVKQKQPNYEEYNIEREAKERVATMLFRTTSPSVSVDYSQSHVCTSCENVNVNVTGQENVTIPISRKVPGIDVLRNRWKRPSTSYSSRNSRYSSFQKSTSAASNDECQPGCNKHIYETGGSVDQTSLHVDDGCSSVTVNVMKESESEQETETNINNMRKMTRSPGAIQTLQVQSPVVALIHSLPDLSLIVPPKRQIQRSPSPVSASEKLYQMHQQSLKSRLAVHNQYLSPDSRGSSYPPLSPTRASLKRGLAFSQSFQKPGLTKMGHVASSSALDQIDAAPTPSPVKSEKASFVTKLLPGTSSDKQEKEKEKEKEKKFKQGRKGKSTKDGKGQK